MRHGANASRWKRHLEHLRQSGWSLSRLQWETAVSSLRGGAARVPLWTSLPATSHHEDGMTFIFPARELCLQYDREHLRRILATHPPPRPWKPRHNDRLRLLCDASAFLNALARFHQPASSFRVFSQAAP